MRPRDWGQARRVCFVDIRLQAETSPCAPLRVATHDPKQTGPGENSSIIFVTMSSREEVTLPATRPKSRKSMGTQPSADVVDKENMTADIGALDVAHKRTTLGDRQSKKSRSKSIGPGGLDALKDATGNRRKVSRVKDNRMMQG